MACADIGDRATWGISSFGRALLLQGRGDRFKPVIFHNPRSRGNPIPQFGEVSGIWTGRLAAKAPLLQSGYRGFESRPVYVKICSVCDKKKELTEFYTRSAMCKVCHHEYNKQHYIENKQAYLVKAKLNNERYRLKFRVFLWDYLTEHPCVVCNENDPIVLDFDHINPANKEFNIAETMKLQIGMVRLKKELAKCQVLCANCHRRRTAIQFGWWKDKQAAVWPLATNELEA
jgi:hypothetical protein